ncbi:MULTISPECIES: class II fructose-bisphosphate aldolase [unclassified Streptomyces]|uniref:class II fructose-bisphosphate aldolase n=1 Tax=unclassified Streptomyces TaxID=2593676 RepID=UPI00081E3596|nr:class II fructose-bisphosphate aldolase [Streptomyces sp. LcepLS]MYR30019.1 fructose-bisphosphate aldolase [Streptomyces sp. SID4945]SCF48435.1 fructose-bisphosphate aldolase, class II [Streptomyces sp. LcepLS]
MALVPTGELVVEAVAGGRGLPAFNVITLEHVEAVVAGAERAGGAVVLQVSENAVRYRLGRLGPLAAAARSAAVTAGVPVGLHLDHVTDAELLRQAADEGFGSVMYDGAKLPYEANLAATCEAVLWAHGHGLWVEAELGEVGGKDGAAPLGPHAPGARTDPGEAAAFVAASGVDGLAVAVGSSHAMTSRTAALDHGLLGRLRDAAGVPLVLHGSSGVPDEEVRAAVRGGITKVNVGTALNVALTAAVRERLGAEPGLVDARGYLGAGREAMAEVVERLTRVVAGAGEGVAAGRG